MTTAAFIAIYAIVAIAVGMAYFLRQQWQEFFDSNRLHGDARERLTLHLMIGAAGVGAAWPVAIVFATYGLCAMRMRRIAERAGEGVGI